LPDIDLDFANRNNVLDIIKHIPAAMRKANPIRKHATGIHVTDVPYDAINNMANIDYSIAESRGYLKLDLLNVHVYDKVHDEKHLTDLMRANAPSYSALSL
jgi:SLT domain-containing protein